MILSVPVCLLSAIYLSEYARSRFRNLARLVIDIMAAIPSVIYGLWGVIVIVPFVRALGQALDITDDRVQPSGRRDHPCDHGLSYYHLGFDGSASHRSHPGTGDRFGPRSYKMASHQTRAPEELPSMESSQRLFWDSHAPLGKPSLF